MPDKYTIRRGGGKTEFDVNIGGVRQAIHCRTSEEGRTQKILDHLLSKKHGCAWNITPGGQVELRAGNKSKLVGGYKKNDNGTVEFVISPKMVDDAIAEITAKPAPATTTDVEPYVPIAEGAVRQRCLKEHAAWQARQDKADARQTELRDNRNLSDSIVERLLALQKAKDEALMQQSENLFTFNREAKRLEQDLQVEQSRSAMMDVLNNPESSPEQRETAKEGYYLAQAKALGVE